MLWYERAKILFEKLDVHEPEQTIIKVFKNEKNKLFKQYLSNTILEQTAGNPPKKIIFVHNNHKYILNRDIIGTDLHYHIYQYKSNDKTCIHLIVDVKEQICNIFNLSYDPKCFFENNKPFNGSGSELLDVALTAIDELKEKINLKMIRLTDNAKKSCKKVKNSMDIGIMSLLIYGDTWYGRKGFKPYYSADKIIYDKNKEIMKNARLCDKKLKNFKTVFIDSLKIYFNNNEKSIARIVDMYDKYYSKNTTIMKFLQNMFKRKDYEYTCDLFYRFYLELHKMLGLENLKSRVYYKNI